MIASSVNSIGKGKVAEFISMPDLIILNINLRCFAII